MKNKTLYILAACINLAIIFLLINKENMFIKLLYQQQQLDEHKNELLQHKKELTLLYHKGQQLSTIESFAKNKLAMRPLSLKDAKKLPTPQEKTSPIIDATQASSQLPLIKI